MRSSGDSLWNYQVQFAGVEAHAKCGGGRGLPEDRVRQDPSGDFLRPRQRTLQRQVPLLRILAA